jgi:hypothetical protein
MSSSACFRISAREDEGVPFAMLFLCVVGRVFWAVQLQHWIISVQ